MKDGTNEQPLVNTRNISPIARNKSAVSSEFVLAVHHYFGAVHSIYCSVNIAMEEDDKAPGGQDKRRSDGPKRALFYIAYNMRD